MALSHRLTPKLTRGPTPPPMKRQLSFASCERTHHKRPIRCETFLALMDRIVPRARFVSAIEPHYFAGGRGHPPVGIEPMLRMYFAQCWVNLSDESAEEVIRQSGGARLLTLQNLNTFRSASDFGVASFVVHWTN